MLRRTHNILSIAVVLAAGLAFVGFFHAAKAEDNGTAREAAAATVDQAGPEVGVLTCKSVPGTRVNLVVHSSVDIECEFKEADGSTEQYVGETGIGLGVDLHVFHDENLTFAVLAHHFQPGSHQLAGRYAGAKAGVSAGVGAGAAILTGGSGGGIGLKPAVTRGKGVGVAAGLGYLVLEPKE